MSSKDELFANILSHLGVDLEETKEHKTPSKTPWRQLSFRLILLMLYLASCYLLDMLHWAFFDNNGGGNAINLNSNKFIANLNKKFEKGKDSPFFWHVPKSGGTSIKNMYSQCYGMVEASESGLANGRPKEPYLNVVDVEQGKYVNVDVSTEEGIDHAASLNLIDSNLADIIVSPLLYKASTSLFSETKQARLMTMFRHPIDRVISIFYYLQKATWEPTYNPAFANMTLRQYAFSQYAESNFIARSLVNKLDGGELTKGDVRTCKKILKDKFLIGLLEDLETSVKRFDMFFGFNAVYDTCKEMYLKKGVNRREGGTAEADLNNVEFKVAYDELKRKNWLDIILYEYAKELYQQQSHYFK